MDNITRRDSEMLYISDEIVYNEQKRGRILTQKLNTMDRSDYEGIARVIAELFGRGEGAMVNPPFYCDYGSHIFVGKNFFANYNCCFLDVGRITFGDNCLLAPNVCITTAGHPVHPAARNTLYEYGIDVTIGNNVWLGANVVVCPGVTIGDNCVIGAGSVVTKDIPAWSVAVGSPCRVIRRITEADRELYFGGRKADDEALSAMREKWASGDEAMYPTAPEE